MFRIEYTVYENHTFTYLHAETTDGSEYIPVNERAGNERYSFEFRDGEAYTLQREDIYVRFPQYPPLAQPGEPSMTSTHMQIPVTTEAEELRITHQGNELETVNLVEEICAPKPEKCNQYCSNHGIGPSCEETGGQDTNQPGTENGDNIFSNNILQILALFAAVALVGAYFLYRKRNRNETQRTNSQTY